VGSQSFIISVQDLSGAEATQEFTINVSGTYQLPVFDAFQDVFRQVVEQPFSATPTVTADPTAQLTFSLFTSPPGMTIDADSGQISWVPPASEFERLRLVIVQVADQFGNADTLSFVMIMDIENAAPQITSGVPQDYIQMRQSYEQHVYFEDPNYREDFDHDLQTSAWWLVPIIRQEFGQDESRLILVGSDRNVSSSFPERVRADDYLCQATGDGLPDPAVPISPYRTLSGLSAVPWSQLIAMPFFDTNEDGTVNESDNSLIPLVANSG
jgi:hypothetical protein